MLLDWNPVALSLGPVRIHWYGLMYLLGFAGFWMLGVVHARRAHTALAPEQVSDLLVYGAVGVIIGGRLGSALFYYSEDLLMDPWMVLRIWEGGMSFHGGLIGVVLAVWFWAYKNQISLLGTLDFCAPLVPVGLLFGRFGNFINGELWGSPTELPWGVIFPAAGPEPRHPSQLYEAALEGLVLFVLLWWVARVPRPAGLLAGLFAIGYALGRIAVEFVRVPDAHIGYLAFGWLTQGQLLCVPLLAVGLVLLFRARRLPT